MADRIVFPDPALRLFAQRQAQQLEGEGDPKPDPKPDPPKPDPKPDPAPTNQPGGRAAHDPDELPDDNDPPTTQSFRRLREAHARSKDRVRELERENADLKTTSESATRLQTQLVEQTVVAQAAGKLADPQDAVRMIDLSKFKVSPDGKVDSKGIGEAVDKLLEAKPYLRAGTAPAQRQLPGPGGQPPVPVGAAAGNEGMNQLIRAAAGRG